MKNIAGRAKAACIPLLLAAIPAAQAQPGVVSKINPDARANEAPSPDYWTAERFRAAKPMPMPAVKPRADIETRQAPCTPRRDRSVSSDAQAPLREPEPAVEQLYDTGSDKAQSQRDAVPQPRDK